MDTILSLDSAIIFYDGIFDEPARLSHPEGVAIHVDGSVWCGTENGDIMRIDKDGKSMERIANTGGWIAGIAFDNKGYLYACDIRYGCVYRLDISSQKLNKFSTIDIKLPNYPVIDLKRNALYVSDSYNGVTPGPGIWKIDLTTKCQNLWYGKDLFFANGMCLSLDGNSLFVIESKRQRVLNIPIDGNGNAGEVSVFVDELLEFPDGLSMDVSGNLYVSCYEPSQIYKVSADGNKTEILIKDPEAILISHPTNTAFRGTELFLTNLGRWHISKVNMDKQGVRLPLDIL